jgi:hypothetical protein
MKDYALTTMFMLILAGCIAGPGPIPSPEESPQEEPVVSCRTVIVEEPYIEEVCEQVSYTEEECEMKELNYTSSQITMTDLCVDDGDCVGKDVSECIRTCTRAMKRCQMEITNEDAYEGTWVVGATFHYNGASFVKNPESKDILPGKSHIFDFQQIYTLGDPPTTATCTVSVLYPAITKVCVDVEKTRIDCTNVTKMRAVETEVCN